MPATARDTDYSHVFDASPPRPPKTDGDEPGDNDGGWFREAVYRLAVGLVSAITGFLAMLLVGFLTKWTVSGWALGFGALSTIRVLVLGEEIREPVLIAWTRPRPRPGTVISGIRQRSEIADRVINSVIAVVALAVQAPIMILAAIAVKTTSRGPIIYSQLRVGVDRRHRSETVLHERRKHDAGGQLFRIYKFRTMYVDAESRSGAGWATSGDPRVTPIGRVLRKTRVDELPQLYNVLRGEMNIVGPRPERPAIFARLAEEIEDYPLRQRAKPGITGWAQINYAYGSTIEDVRTKVRYDLEYLSRMGIAEDLKIMARTLPVMVFRKDGW
jgi:lipopolysaccharide/colanic/teichoic acid biosynthesis glycosyltransferase